MKTLLLRLIGTETLLRFIRMALERIADAERSRIAQYMAKKVNTPIINGTAEEVKMYKDALDLVDYSLSIALNAKVN